MPGAVAAAAACSSTSIASAAAASSVAPNPTTRGDPLSSNRCCRITAPYPLVPPPLAATRRLLRHGCRGAPPVARPHQAQNPRVRFTAAGTAAEGMAAEASTADAASAAEAKPFGVLFVCLGNICRSPAAEAVFRNLVSKRGLVSKFHIDSAGTIGYHEGNKADSRMRSASKKRGIEVTSISRPIKPSDFRDFDLILAMDRQNQGRAGGCSACSAEQGLRIDGAPKKSAHYAAESAFIVPGLGLYLIRARSSFLDFESLTDGPARIESAFISASASPQPLRCVRCDLRLDDCRLGDGATFRFFIPISSPAVRPLAADRSDRRSAPLAADRSDRLIGHPFIVQARHQLQGEGKRRRPPGPCKSVEDILNSFERWRHKELLPDSAANKVKLMCSCCKRHTESEVPDPYYGGSQGFEKVLDLLEDACESLLDSIVADNANISG